MEEMTEQEALYILRNCYVMKTDHTLDEENIKLKQAIKKILKINKKRNQRNKELREKNKKMKQNSISKQIIGNKLNDIDKALDERYEKSVAYMQLQCARNQIKELLGE